MIRAGQLRIRLNIEKPVMSRGDTGEYLKTWEHVATRNVERREMSRALGTSEFHDDYQERAANTYQLILRWERKLKCLTPLWRFVECDDTDKVYEILAVDNVLERNREFRVRAEVVY